MDAERSERAMRGQVNGIDHPTWEDGSPILVGQHVRWHEESYLARQNGGWYAVVHEVSADEVRIGGMNSDDDEEWEEQVSPDELTAYSGRMTTTAR